MCRGHPIGLPFGNKSVELFVADPMTGRFDRRAVGLRPRTNIEPGNLDWNLKVSRNDLAELLVRVRSGAPQLVVHMEEAGDRPVGLDGQIRQDRGQGDGVAAARQRHRDPSPGWN